MNVNFITVLNNKKMSGEMLTVQLISQICVVMLILMNVSLLTVEQSIVLDFMMNSFLYGIPLKPVEIITSMLKMLFLMLNYNYY
jgi:hypothetical protein